MLLWFAVAGIIIVPIFFILYACSCEWRIFSLQARVDELEAAARAPAPVVTRPLWIEKISTQRLPVVKKAPR